MSAPPAVAPHPRPRRPTEALLVWAGVTVALVGLSLTGRLDGTMVAGLLLFPPVLLNAWRREPLAWLGLKREGAVRSLLEAVGAGVVFFPPYIILRLWLFPEDGGALPGVAATLELFALQIGAVALPEELFFRGYLQQELPESWRWKAIGLSALLFALAHVAVTPAPARLLVFFPGLVFGWLQQRHGNLAGPVLFHALCNTVALSL